MGRPLRLLRVAIAALAVCAAGILLVPSPSAQACSVTPDPRAVRPADMADLDSPDGEWGRRYTEHTGFPPPRIVGAVRLTVVSVIEETSTHDMGAVVAPSGRWATTAEVPVQVKTPSLKGQPCRGDSHYSLGDRSYVLIGERDGEAVYRIPVLMDTAEDAFERDLTMRFGEMEPLGKPHIPTRVGGDNPLAPLFWGVLGALVGVLVTWLVVRRQRIS